MKKIITSILMAATIVSLSTTNVLAAEDLLIDDINIVDEGLEAVETEDSSLISEDGLEESLDYASEYDIIEDYSDDISIDTLSLSELSSNDISEEYSEDMAADTSSNVIRDNTHTIEDVEEEFIIWPCGEKPGYHIAYRSSDGAEIPVANDEYIHNKWFITVDKIVTFDNDPHYQNYVYYHDKNNKFAVDNYYPVNSTPRIIEEKNKIVIYSNYNIYIDPNKESGKKTSIGGGSSNYNYFAIVSFNKRTEDGNYYYNDYWNGWVCADDTTIVRNYIPSNDNEMPLEYFVKKDNTIEILGISKSNIKNNESNSIYSLIIPSEIDGVTVTSINLMAFDNFGYKVDTITIPSTIKEIPYCCFRGISYMGDNPIIIPEGIEKIGDYAFCGLGHPRGSSVLSNVRLILPSTLKEIGQNAFDFVFGSRSVNGREYGNLTIPEGVEKIGKEAFFGITGFENITIPSTVKEIGQDAFMYISLEDEEKIENWIVNGNCGKGELKNNFASYSVKSITNKSNVSLRLPGLPGSPYGLTWTDKETGERLASVSNGQTAILSNSDYVYEIQEREVVASQTMNLDVIFDEEGFCYTIDDGIYAKRYTVDNKKLASIAKNKLKANKIGTVKVTQEVKWEKTSDFEPTATCDIIILPKPALKFNKPLTYEGQSIDGFEYAASSYYDLRQYKIIYWRSSNTKVAEVDEDGIIIAKGQGTTTISAYIEDEGRTNKIVIAAKLTVKYPKFNKPSYTYKTGDKIVLAMKNVNASLEPEFEAAGESINVYPQLDKKGNPTGKVVIETLSCGDATLTAIIDDQEYTCDIHVTAPKINKNKLTLRKNKYTSLSLSNTKIKKQNVVWESENDSIATIDEKGRIKGISEGEVIIFTNTGGIRNECVVTVK